MSVAKGLPPRRPRSNGARANSARASASSSPTWRGRPTTSSPLATSAGLANNGSRRARARFDGHDDCHAAGRRQRRSSSASCARLRPREPPAHAGDARVDSGLVAGESQGRPIKIGAKVVDPGRYVAFQMTEVAIPRSLFADILRLIAALRPPPVISTTQGVRRHAFPRKPRQSCILLTEKSSRFGSRSRAGAFRNASATRGDAAVRFVTLSRSAAACRGRPTRSRLDASRLLGE